MKKLIDYKKEYNSLSTKKDLSGKGAVKAVENDGCALRYVKDQSEAVCLKAVENDGYALRYVNNKLFDDIKATEPILTLDGIDYSETTLRSIIKKATNET